MDPITHGVIGMAISTFSGQSPELSSAITLGATLGAMAPDLDVVLRVFKDEMTYLKHHRGFSHALPSLLIGSGLITLGLSFMGLSDFNWWQVWFWTFIGALSHTGFDLLNSYGAMLFSKKQKASLLTLYDPVVSALALYLIFFRPETPGGYGAVVLIFFAYLMARRAAKNFVRDALEDCFAGASSPKEPLQIDILPGLKSFYKWDFIIQSNARHIVGKYNGFSGRIEVIEILEQEAGAYSELFFSTQLGQYLSEFSPNIHLKVEDTDQGKLITAVDLRYHYRNNFLHHGSMHVDHEGRVVKSFLHPYKLNRRILVEEYSAT